MNPDETYCLSHILSERLYNYSLFFLVIYFVAWSHHSFLLINYLNSTHFLIEYMLKLTIISLETFVLTCMTTLMWFKALFFIEEMWFKALRTITKAKETCVPNSITLCLYPNFHVKPKKSSNGRFILIFAMTGREWQWTNGKVSYHSIVQFSVSSWINPTLTGNWLNV